MRKLGVYRKAGALYLDWYEGGRRRRKKTGARTKTEAKQLLAKVTANLVPRELGIFDSNLTVAHLVVKYLEVLKATRTEATWEWAQTCLKNFFTRHPMKRVSQVTPELIGGCISWRRKTGVSPRTINVELTALKGCLNWGVKNGLVRRGPFVDGVCRAWGHGLP